ncbi:hypothetical protein ASG40_11620 [Methylobacterium sp. Leaf399]|uniref:hypothetical protein n=1 Tax=Methylobacterium sp. Leaf399 TaxID=1736364 RepID=UPI00070189C9|nr:hypothetical protein [Methylobacterium sp. Leaf399]KQT08520.1 hypothetical protein ASG40_11620 [Methylobacterium sp. Leaf399]
MVKAVLLKPLDGLTEGSEHDFEQDDFNRLERLGAVRKVAVAKAAPPVLNKAAPPVANKSLDLGRTSRKG